MDSAKRVIANTAAQYTKAVVNICLSLYSTRLILDALNVSDYGIYSVVAGVVGILGYLTNALVTTTQRYLSYYQGAGDVARVKNIFLNSLVLHIGMAILIFAALLSLEHFLMDVFLNIDKHRLDAAKFVYVTTALMLVTTIATAPFKSLLISRENIIYISIVEICDGFLKLILALTLLLVNTDKLVFYALGMLVVLLVNFGAFIVYCVLKYEESHVFSRKECRIDKACMKDITGFAGWTTFGMLAGVCQMQGSAIILNKFFGTIMNAAFGIAMQINGAVKFVSTSVLNAMNPQIMKAEGNGDREAMLQLAGKESKFSTALMMIISIPIIMEMPNLLDIWLKDVPENTVMFSRALMIAFIIDQTTLGLHAANQAMGRIRCYTLITTIPKILIVPIMWSVFHFGLSVSVAMWVYVGVEMLVALIRIPFMRSTAGLNMGRYLSCIIGRLLPLAIALTAASILFNTLLDFRFRFLLSIPTTIIVGLIAFWFGTLDKEEREYTSTLIRNKIGNANSKK